MAAKKKGKKKAKVKKVSKASVKIKAKKKKPSKSVKTTTHHIKNRYNKTDLKHFKDLINEKRKKLFEELGYLENVALGMTSKESSGDLSSYSYHMADQATDAQEREKAFHFASREGRFLFHLNQALERITKGNYGICMGCGCLVSKERLEAVPHARLCIKCKTAEEEGHFNK